MFDRKIFFYLLHIIFLILLLFGHVIVILMSLILHLKANSNMLRICWDY